MAMTAISSDYLQDMSWTVFTIAGEDGWRGMQAVAREIVETSKRDGRDVSEVSTEKLSKLSNGDPVEIGRLYPDHDSRHREAVAATALALWSDDV